MHLKATFVLKFARRCLQTLTSDLGFFFFNLSVGISLFPAGYVSITRREKKFNSNFDFKESLVMLFTKDLSYASFMKSQSHLSAVQVM